MTTITRRDAVAPHPAVDPYYVPSPALLTLISDIAHAPSLDSRLWAGVTLALELGSRHPPDAETKVLATIGAALASGYATDPAFELR